ncbi:hypothetical protein GQQ23_20430 (plasmid) [Pantoea agglomerans]|nr:hypothetical protein [Pantoea agglomerans]
MSAISAPDWLAADINHHGLILAVISRLLAEPNNIIVPTQTEEKETFVIMSFA